jgi:ferrochelatase
MRYGSPSLPEVLDRLKAEGVDRIAILPAYPQYSGTTTGSIWDAVFRHYAQVRNIPVLRLVKHYHDHDGYIDALGDPYHCECQKTARLLADRLRLTPSDYVVSFQSRFGKAEWLQPYTAATVQKLAREGVRKLDVICPGFTSDCLETLEEINMEVRREFEAAGGQDYHYIPCLNESNAWIAGMAEIAEQHLIGWPTMMSPSQREAQRRDAEAGRERALQLGA